MLYNLTRSTQKKGNPKRKASTRPTTWTNARRSETRVKERADHLPVTIWEETRRNSAAKQSHADEEQFTKEPYSRLFKSHTGSTISKEERLQSNPIPSIFLTRKPSSLKIRRSPKMKRLATTTRRRSDEIKAKEREAIGPRRTESIDQHNRRKTPERNRCRLREEMRRGDKSRIAPSKRARATGGKSRLYSSKRPYYTGDRVTEKKSATGIGASSHHLPRERYERENEEER
ncbi:hypothetical protein Bca101_047087 [Brassica carinata]